MAKNEELIDIEEKKGNKFATQTCLGLPRSYRVRSAS